MSPTVESILEQARQLTEDDQERLRLALLADCDPAIDDALVRKVSARLRAIDSGEARLHDGESILKKLRQGERLT